MPVTIDIRDQPFDPWTEMQKRVQGDALPAGAHGAIASFVGTMRDFNEGDNVSSMTLEHYPGMTEHELKRIVEDTMSKWPLLDVLVIHRVGRLEPGDDIVLVAVWSAHRAEAFDGCRDIMEALKSRAPFWKKENLGAAERWVESNTPDTRNH